MAERRIGPYLVLRKLGAGGMGEVFEARRGSSERVALKLLTAPTAHGRFREEMRLAESLQHPNLVPLLDDGEAEGKPFFTMPLLKGATLAELRALAPRAWPEGLVLHLAGQSLEALQFLHAHEVVHRDVKPSNLFLCEDGTLRLIDYGIARVIDGDNTTTQTGQLVGSIRYVSPEQAQGRDVDLRSDLFSLAVTLQELLTGERVFAQEEHVAILTALLMERVPRVDELRPGVGEDTASALASMLEKSREARPTTVEAVRASWPSLLGRAWRKEDAAQWLATTLKSRAPDTADERIPELVSARQRGRVVTWALWSAAGVALVGGGLEWWHLHERKARPASPVELVSRERPPPVPLPTPVAPVIPAPKPAPPPEPVVVTRPSPAPPPTHAATRTRRFTSVQAKDAAGTGWLTLDVRPGYAHVRVDGVAHGETPMFRLGLRAGTHRIELLREDGDRRRTQVTIVKGQEHSEVVRWPPP